MKMYFYNDEKQKYPHLNELEINLNFKLVKDYTSYQLSLKEFKQFQLY